MDVSGLDSRLTGLGLNPYRGHCVVFLCNKLTSHSAPLYLRISLGNRKLNAGGKLAID